MSETEDSAGLLDFVAWAAGGRRNGRVCVGQIVGALPADASLAEYGEKNQLIIPAYCGADRLPYRRFIVVDSETLRIACVHPRWVSRVTGDVVALRYAARGYADFVRGMRPLSLGDNGGCGGMTHVVGTNGGTMPCGAMLACFGVTKPYYCPACEARINAADPGVEYAYVAVAVYPSEPLFAYGTASEAKAAQEHNVVAWLKSDENVGVEGDGKLVTIVRVAVKNTGKDKNNAKTEG